jgi:hypothetical protein
LPKETQKEMKKILLDTLEDETNLTY